MSLQVVRIHVLSLVNLRKLDNLVIYQPLT